MTNNKKSNGGTTFLIIIGVHVLGYILSLTIGSSEPYGREHRLYYFVLLMLSGMI